jgi:hypothetical protein
VRAKYCFSHLVTTNSPVINWNSTGITVAGVAAIIGITSSLLSHSNGVAIDIYSNLYVADADNQRIQRFAPGSTVGQTVAGTTAVIGSTSNKFNFPRAIFVARDVLYVSDISNFRIQMYTYNASTAVTVAGGNV